MFTFGVVATLAVLLAVLVVALAYDSTPDETCDVCGWARRVVARVAGWLW